MALGSAILGGVTLGVGLLAGGIILDSAGSSVLKKADKVWDQMLENEEKIDGLCNYMSDLKGLAAQYISTQRFQKRCMSIKVSLESYFMETM